jgi:hypothetical protein
LGSPHRAAISLAVARMRERTASSTAASRSFARLAVPFDVLSEREGATTVGTASALAGDVPVRLEVIAPGGGDRCIAAAASGARRTRVSFFTLVSGAASLVAADVMRPRPGLPRDDLAASADFRGSASRGGHLVKRGAAALFVRPLDEAQDLLDKLLHALLNRIVHCGGRRSTRSGLNETLAVR